MSDIGAENPTGIIKDEKTKALTHPTSTRLMTGDFSQPDEVRNILIRTKDSVADLKYVNTLRKNDPNISQEELQRDRTIEKVRRWTELLRNGDVTRETFLDEVLPTVGVERDEQGRIILYHATTFQNLIPVLEGGMLKPPTETNNFVWRTVHEDASEDPHHVAKKEKVYLAKKSKIHTIAEAIRPSTHSGVYILEVKTDPDNLRPDEDARVDEDDDWARSLAIAGTASNKGRLTDISVVGRIDPSLGDEMLDFIHRRYEARTEEEKQKIDQEYRQKIAEQNETERKALEPFGINISALPSFEN